MSQKRPKAAYGMAGLTSRMATRNASIIGWSLASCASCASFAVLRCGGAVSDVRERGDETPVALLASSPVAQTELRNLTKRFEHATPAQRVALEPELLRFQQKYPSEPASRL